MNPQYEINNTCSGLKVAGSNGEFGQTRQLDGRARALTWPRLPLHSWEPSPSVVQPSPESSVWALEVVRFNSRVARLFALAVVWACVCWPNPCPINSGQFLNQGAAASQTHMLHTHFLTHTCISGSIRPDVQPVEVVHIHMFCGQDEILRLGCRGPGSFCCMLMDSFQWLEGVTSTWMRMGSDVI